MAAAAAAAVSSGDKIELCKDPVYIFLIVMHTFNKIATAARKGIFLLLCHQFIQSLQAIGAYAAVKSLR